MGIVAAGAFAAMFSTIGGLLIAAASAIGHDVYEKYINKDASEAKRVAVAKISVVSFALIALGLGLAIPASGLDKAYPALIAMMVTWAFAVGGLGIRADAAHRNLVEGHHRERRDSPAWPSASSARSPSSS